MSRIAALESSEALFLLRINERACRCHLDSQIIRTYRGSNQRSDVIYIRTPVLRKKKHLRGTQILSQASLYSDSVHEISCTAVREL